MLRMEWRNTLKASGLCLCLLMPGLLIVFLKIPAARFMNFAVARVFRILEPGTEIPAGLLLLLFFFAAILLTANILGFNAFRAEHEDRAFEYLFTLPLSKRKILIYKIVPRILTLAVLFIIYAIAFYSVIGKANPIAGPFFFLMNPPFFFFVVSAFFWSGFFIGVFEMKNWVALVTLLSFGSLAAAPSVVHTLLSPTYPAIWSLASRSGLSFTIGSMFLMIVLGGCSLSTFRTMDLRSLAGSSRLFAWRALGPMGIICGYGSVIILKWIIQNWL